MSRFAARLRARPVSLAAAVLAAALGLWALRVALWRPLAVVPGTPSDLGPRLAGVLHVHTTLSDGTGTPEQVIEAARAAGLGFLALTDHNNLDAKPVEGYDGDLLVMVGTEISTQSGHILALGIPDPVYRFSGDAEDALSDVRQLGGIAFVTHPESPAANLRWTRWNLPGPWGLEVLNLDSQWRLAGVPRLLRTVVSYPLNRRYSLLSTLQTPTRALDRWDALLAKRDVPATAGADAHGRIPLFRSFSIPLPSYGALFRLVRTHVLLDRPLAHDAAADSAAVVEALRRGHAYLAVDGLAPAEDFYFRIEGGGERWRMGDTVPAGPGLRLEAGGSFPEGARIELLRDGRPIEEGPSPLSRAEVAPGVYRVEVHVPGWSFPWILSNPISVFDADARKARRRRAAWPTPGPVPEIGRMLDRFEGTTSFKAEADSTSRVPADPVDPHGGLGGSGAARLGFALAPSSPGHPHTFCALVDRTHRDFSGWTGLELSIRADGVYRIWFQVRDANPRSKDDGTEWWFRSIRTSTEWRRVVIPFASLRSINPRTDGRLDLDKVRALVFVLDRGAIKLGTEGSIWIDDLGLYREP